MPNVRAWTVLLLLFALVSRPVWAVEGEESATAAAAAGDFVVLLDAKSPGEAWRQFTPFARIAKPREQWQALQQALRTAYGPLEQRALRGVTLQNRYAMIPDGRCAIVQFDTTFGRKRNCVETVVLVLTGEGHWQVHDYVVN